MKTIISSLLLTSAIAAADTPVNFYNQAMRDPEILSVFKIITDKPSVSLSVYESKDCSQYTLKFTNTSPDFIKTQGGFYGILPKGEIQSGLKCIRMDLCFTPDNCQTSIIALISNKEGQYIKASPHYFELLE